MATARTLNSGHDHRMLTSGHDHRMLTSGHDHRMLNSGHDGRMLNSGHDRRRAGLLADVADLFQTLARALYDPYRPEQHYMRGPGPRWHAKFDPASGQAIPALIRVRNR